MKIAESGPLVLYCVGYTVENYSLSPTFSCKSGGRPLFLALTATPQDARSIYMYESMYTLNFSMHVFSKLRVVKGYNASAYNVIGTGYEGGVCVIVLLMFRAFVWYRLLNFEILRQVVPFPRAGHIELAIIVV